MGTSALRTGYFNKKYRHEKTLGGNKQERQGARDDPLSSFVTVRRLSFDEVLSSLIKIERSKKKKKPQVSVRVSGQSSLTGQPRATFPSHTTVGFAPDPMQDSAGANLAHLHSAMQQSDKYSRAVGRRQGCWRKRMCGWVRLGEAAGKEEAFRMLGVW